MTHVASLALAGLLLLLLNVAPSWGGPPNPTESDGDGNTAGGRDALVLVEDPAIENTAFGAYALSANTGGSCNTAVGHSALVSNVSGSDNTAVGVNALAGANGSANTATGASALNSNSTGYYNIAHGHAALFSNEAGSYNTALGARALLHSAGNRNIAIGHEAGIVLINGNKNVYVGHPGIETESRTMRLGNKQTQTFIAGVNVSAVTGSPVLIDADGRLGTQLSSARYKRDIEPMAARSQPLHQLRPVTFRYTHDAEQVRQYGLVAEDVAAVYPELVTRTATGNVQAVRYQELIPMLVNELQRQQQHIDRQQQELIELRALVGGLRGSIGQQ